MSNELRGVWAVLKEIKEEQKSFDDKWERHIAEAATDRQKLAQISDAIQHVEQILTRGNGQKPVLSQLEGLHRDVVRNKRELEMLKVANDLKTPEDAEDAEEARKLAEADAQKAKWVAVAKWAGVITLAIPGILALLGVHG